jgi:hypothetical protein
MALLPAPACPGVGVAIGHGLLIAAGLVTAGTAGPVRQSARLHRKPPAYRAMMSAGQLSE